MSLQPMIDLIARTYPFDGTVYPSLAQASPSDIRAFAVRHSVLHMSKSLGKIAAFAEEEDHGGVGDVALLREATVKMLINTLRLAEVLGMTAEDIEREVPMCLKNPVA